MKLQDVKDIQRTVSPFYNNFGEWTPHTRYEAMRLLLIQQVEIYRNISEPLWSAERVLNDRLKIRETQVFSPYSQNGVRKYRIQVSIPVGKTISKSLVMVAIPPHLLNELTRDSLDDDFVSNVYQLEKQVIEWIKTYPYLKASDVYQETFIAGLIEYITNHELYSRLIAHIHGEDPVTHISLLTRIKRIFG